MSLSFLICAHTEGLGSVWAFFRVLIRVFLFGFAPLALR